ncbi:MAG: hypothetical protein WC539_03220 [Nitrospirota bacterium]
MVEINSTFFIQLANFLILLLVLNILLFKPTRRILQEREQEITSALDETRAAQEKIKELLVQHAALLAEAKQRAANAYQMRYQEGLDAQADMIAAERNRAATLLETGRQEIATVSTAARAGLQKNAESLSKEITHKLLGRTA